jgi:hypothetical protein
MTDNLINTKYQYIYINKYINIFFEINIFIYFSAKNQFISKLKNITIYQSYKEFVNIINYIIYLNLN